MRGGDDNVIKGGEQIIKSIFIRFIIFLAILILTSSLYIGVKIILENQKSKDLNDELINNTIVENIDDNEKNMIINWNKLNEINNDIVAWIRIDGTNINYPILKDNENLKYLKRTYSGEYNSNGSIFTLDENAFESKITTVYGHNMKNGLMFSQLSKYMDKKFLNEHKTFSIFTSKEEYRATIFSCYSTNVYEEEKSIRDLEFEEEIKYYKKNSKHILQSDVKIKKIVKLCTCSYLNNRSVPTTERYYIVAYLEKI